MEPRAPRANRVTAAASSSLSELGGPCCCQLAISGVVARAAGPSRREMDVLGRANTAPPYMTSFLVQGAYGGGCTNCTGVGGAAAEAAEALGFAPGPAGAGAEGGAAGAGTGGRGAGMGSGIDVAAD
jgi:hypothetical protein